MINSDDEQDIGQDLQDQEEDQNAVGGGPFGFLQVVVLGLQAPGAPEFVDCIAQELSHIDLRFASDSKRVFQYITCDFCHKVKDNLVIYKFRHLVWKLTE